MARLKKPTAALLSATVPGLGQLYLGEYARAAATLVMSLTVWGAAVFMCVWGRASNAAVVISLGPVYLLVLVPAVREAWQRAEGPIHGRAPGDSRTYVLIMLACMGPMALPLLWQNPRFGTPAKITWTVLVTLMLVGGVWLLATMGAAVDDALRQLHELQDLQSFPIT